MKYISCLFYKFFANMFRLLRIILYKLLLFSTLTLFSSIIVFWTLGIIAAFLIILFGITGLLYTVQDLLLYYPNDPPNARTLVLQPSIYKLPFESIKIKTKDGYKIHMFLIKQEINCNHTPTMIFFHGNAGNMGQRLSNVYGFYHNLNINILMVEYRGYGLSEGSPSEHGFYIDAETAIDYIMQRPDIDRSRIMLFGRSLGGAVAIDLASRLENRNKIWALVVENSFTSIPDMAEIILRWKCLKWLPKFCHKNKYMSLKKIGQVLTPTLIICGTNDTVVPPSMSKDLFIRCGAICKQFEIISGGGHDDTWTCKDYYASIQKFLLNAPPMSEEIGHIPNDELKNLSVSHETVHIV